MDCTVHGVTMNQTRLSDFYFTAFFMVQFLYPYMTTGKTIALTIQTVVGNVMSLLFSTLSTFVIAFLPRSNHHYPASNPPLQQECPGFPLANYHPKFWVRPTT